MVWPSEQTDVSSRCGSAQFRIAERVLRPTWIAVWSVRVSSRVPGDRSWAALPTQLRRTSPKIVQPNMSKKWFLPVAAVGSREAGRLMASPSIVGIRFRGSSRRNSESWCLSWRCGTDRKGYSPTPRIVCATARWPSSLRRSPLAFNRKQPLFLSDSLVDRSVRRSTVSSSLENPRLQPDTGGPLAQQSEEKQAWQCRS